ncbi:Hypothetical protein R9X50_00135900 [Acrodontium crateriforme]|uniref:NAD(P)-binding domain-containing protein n=1 Tax=Acrodontium crateriforme TaxID=150365 RepID=A0AAQ3M1X5_9PEZI|nr:Hypothetical protein R9X50_00135900 [Acrodontium crateriforme]
MATVALAGSTGLVGSHILDTLSKYAGVQEIYAFARKDLPEHTKLKPLISSDSASWAAKYPNGAPLFISALGTTRANAGGFENQRKIDYDLNLALAKAAKDAGAKAYVLVSSSGANSASMSGYMKMKGELEDAVKALDFDHTVIMRPGLIVGDRNEMRSAEFVMRKTAGFLGSISGGKLKDFWAQDADVIAKAAVKAGLDCLDGKITDKVTMVYQADVIRLGKTEWRA